MESQRIEGRLKRKVSAHYYEWLPVLLSVFVLGAALRAGDVIIAAGTTSGNTWIVTGATIVPHVAHTATLLPDGHVLIAGGCRNVDCAPALTEAETYDPLLGRWTVTGSMGTGRYDHTATLLPNGHVLVTGGCADNAVPCQALNTTELYNPHTGTWSPSSPMLHARHLHTATVLPNGLVLITGGSDQSGAPLNAAELYDPGTGRWTLARPMHMARVLHTATLLSTGLVLVAGGDTTLAGAATAGTTATAELYNPRTNTWTVTSPMGSPRRAHTATALPDGQVLVAGGEDGEHVLDTAELYNASTGTWASTAKMHVPHYNHAATLLATGDVLITGGRSVDVDQGTPSAGPIAAAEVYDRRTNMWTTLSPMKSPRTGHTATLLTSGQVLVTGGLVNDDAVLASAELYGPHLPPLQVATRTPKRRTTTWTMTGHMHEARADHTATLLPDGRVLIAGGCGSSIATCPINRVELYDPRTGSFTSAAPMLHARSGHTAVLLATGQVLVLGGHSTETQASGTCTAELFTPRTNHWRIAGSMTTQRHWYTMTLLRTGDVLVVGGTQLSGDYCPTSSSGTGAALPPSPPRSIASNPMLMYRSGLRRSASDQGLRPHGVPQNPPAPDNPLCSAEVYNPHTSHWQSITSMRTCRFGHTATLLPSGRVLVAGGGTTCDDSGCKATSSAEEFDPSTGTWSPTGSMHEARMFAAATLLRTGKVLIVGGFAGGCSFSGAPCTTVRASAELYDPRTGRWATAERMASPLDHPIPTLLRSGQVLVVGSAKPFNTELYDPQTGHWTPGNMIVNRTGSTATLLKTGAVLVVGGRVYHGRAFSSAEVYRPANAVHPKTNTALSNWRLE